MPHRLTLAVALIASLEPATIAAGEEQVLTIRSASLEAGAIGLSMADLEALPQVTFTTGTVWTDGKREFRGPSLKVLLDSLQIEGATVKARALNDYMVAIPYTTLEDGAPIIATRIDGKPFSRREKGPLWIVYPYDSAKRFQSETVYGRSIWQLNELQVE